VTDPTAAAAPGGARTRDRLLDAAAQLFYERGIHVGVDAVCRAAGVSKKSLYELFGTKDALLAATMERVGPAVGLAVLPPADDDRPPRERILHVFERLEALEPEHEFRGCPLVAAAVQVKSPQHPASAVARRHKDGLTAFFAHEARRAGAQDPVQLARQLTVVFDGASARSVMQARDLDGLAVATARAILDAAGVPLLASNGAVSPHPDGNPVVPPVLRSG
jgi:AcrR family transcriptional regulator